MYTPSAEIIQPLPIASTNIGSIISGVRIIVQWIASPSITDITNSTIMLMNMLNNADSVVTKLSISNGKTTFFT
ncbi:hypothetical protein, partial [Klebsiella pneumoniae]